MGKLTAVASHDTNRTAATATTTVTATKTSAATSTATTAATVENCLWWPWTGL